MYIYVIFRSKSIYIYIYLYIFYIISVKFPNSNLVQVAFTNVLTEVPGSPIFLMQMVSKALSEGYVPKEPRG